MTDWEPATETETALRDALRADDQERYFRILAGTDLYLPVSAQALAGEAPMGWGTWTTGGRTHVLAFTSPTAMRACLGVDAGPSRRVPFAELAAAWPHHEWWLAVNPGLPVEGYLPAWFVSQLSRGDVRLPGRTAARSRVAPPPAEALASDAGDAWSQPEPVPPVALRAPAERPPGWPGAVGEPYPTRPDTTGVGPANGGSPSPLPGPVPRAVPADAGAHPAARPDGEPGTGTRTDPHGGPGRPGESWPVPPRRRLLGEGLGARLAASDASPNGRNSFFEPASGRGAASRPMRDNPLRAGERAAPPLRPGLGGQPFPRRRPAGPPGEDPARAFRMDPAEGSPAPPGPRPDPVPPGPRPDPATEEPTRAFRVPAAESLQALPRRTPTPAPRPAEEPTQPLPDPAARSTSGAGTPVDGPAVEEVPASFAPPESRRGFSPIVIEGVVIEAHDLPVSAGARPGTAPVQAGSGPATTGWRPTGEPTTPDPGEPVTTAWRLAGEPATTVPPDEEPTARLVRPGALPPASEPTVSLSPAVSPDAAVSPSPAVSPDARVSPSPTAGTTAVDAAADRPAAPQAAAASAEPSTVGQSDPAPVGVAADPQRSTSGQTGPPPPTVPTTDVTFQPANEVEQELLDAAGSGSTDTFLSTLLLARVLLPVAPDSAPGSRPGDPGFVWRTEELDGERYVVVHTSPQRLADHGGEGVETVEVRFVQLIRRWPEEDWSFAVNPGTPVGAKLPGEQIVALANWAAEVGLGDDAGSEPEASSAPRPADTRRHVPPAVDPTKPVIMQKAVAPSQLAYYLERGYDRVSGFVHRANELAHLTTPAKLHEALGLGYPDSPFAPDAEKIYVLRWPAYRPSLYRIPYGGQNEAAMRAMEGWVIERAPFRGNGFAPGESSDVVAEFKVDSARLPHGAQLWRIGADGTERMVAVLDTDALLWRQVGVP
ncbi:SseB family protein [Micromonospora sp. KC721]|uniref:SseB family protein n=1 Tax=Micromonospora sp. KC721 TaxID=2530380 RepID=UPI0010498293|nr:SseB family protein [Micromonospora sp. KC721]TDB82138.1 hypothetical protein E1182_02415 [Micromonospora sp. KC721]